MSAKSSAFRAAPPIRPPSTSGFASSSSALAGFMLPPY
ncbi:secreted protein [gut metagenome]|uniref:Secreted protein n=1 Tax=gut metagenome TaxID=749906 RepID=J9CTG0_9ZZZZ